MTAIKEYPFDLSDLKDGPDRTKNGPTTNVSESREPQTVPVHTHHEPTPSFHPDGKRKVSIIEDVNRSSKVTSTAEGPTRRKSNLVLNSMYENDSANRPTPTEGRYKKYSTNSSVYSTKKAYPYEEPASIESSWWYSCCKKFHQEDSGLPSWEPPHWQKICPYPLCPTYRQFSQTLSLFIIGIAAWITLWVIAGDLAAPGGMLFDLAALTLAAHFAGWLFTKVTTLPPLIGKLLIGILLKNVGLINISGDFAKMSSVIRKIALTIILTRAGLDLDPAALKRLFFTVLKLGLGPWIFECVFVAILGHFILGMPWIWGLLLGSVIAAVSPAVVVPCLFRLRSKGYGVSKGIPTIVLAISGIDDAASVAVFGIIASIMFSTSSFTTTIIQGPLSVVAGIGFGALCGYLCKYVPEKNDPFVVPIRVTYLLVGGLVSVLGSEEIGWGGGGPLGVIVLGFLAIKHWSEQGWDLEDNPVATAFEIMWMFFEPMLFGITGAQVDIRALDPDMVLLGSGIIVLSGILRIFLTAALGIGSNLNLKEKFFMGLSCMAKATVQAALAPVALDSVNKMVGGGENVEALIRYANDIVTLCILSIVITAPLGAILITITGPRMLTKTTQKPQVLEGWRRSHRPSIRDISIIGEEELAEREAELAEREDELSRRASPAVPSLDPVPHVVTVQPHSRT